MAKPKIVVAYSGGLDTSVMVRWLIEHYDAEIITFTGNLGQQKELIGVEEKAIATGASKAIIEDLTEDFVVNFCFPALRAGALYEGVYPMATSLGRPVLAKRLAEIAIREGATYAAHGCTGKGNDQVRFETTVGALAPGVVSLAPLRAWEFKSREEEIEYAKLHNIPVKASKENPYSIDENIWGTSIECGILEDPWAAPPEDAYTRTSSVADAPDEPTTIELRFEAGLPVSLDGETLAPVELVAKLNELGGMHGVGRLDLVENRLVGIKSREIYEAPGATILHLAHKELERITLDKPVMDLSAHLSQQYANLVYNGLWFSPLKAGLDAFFAKTQRVVTGEVRIQLFKGQATALGRKADHSLYDESLATYTAADQFDHTAAEGFIKIFSLPLKTVHRVQGNPLAD